jgi:hypothetical protein
VHLPLAALVQDSTLILHGGLFRAPPKKGKGSKRRRASGAQAQQLVCQGFELTSIALMNGCLLLAGLNCQLSCKA